MKKKFLLSMAIVFMLLNFTVFGASDIECNLSADQESKEVSVSVFVDGDKGGTAVTGIVFNDDGAAVFVAQGITDKNGKFEFSYINKDYNGIYTLSVAAPRKGLSKEMYFNMVTDDMKADIDATTKDAAGIESIINNYGIYMNIDFTAFNALSSSGKNAVYSTMARSESIDFSSIKSITEGFYGAVVIETLKENGGKSSDYLAFLTDENYSFLTKDSIKGDSGNVLFDELHDDIKNAVLAKAAAKNYTSISELNSTFDFLVLEKSLEKALQWTEVHPIMLKYQQAGKLPGIDFAGYNQLKNQYVADGAMIGKEYSDYAQIVTAFNNAVALAKQKMTSSGKTSASSGGGGGGGSGFAIPSVKLPEPVEKGNTSQQLTVFSDMDDYPWANEAVSYLVEKGIISGVGDNKFAPSKGLTREEISTILVRTRKIDVGTHKSGFLDVPEDRWSYPYVSAVFESGLMVGLSNDLFGAESQITRNQYAVVMKRLIDLYGGEIAESPTIEDYADESSIPDWAIESVRYMKATGLMLGKTDSQFAGDEIVSRAYACDVLYSVLTALNYDLEEQQ